MELNLAFFALAIPAVLFAGISKGGFGSGAAFAAAPFLAVAVPPQLAVGVMLPLLMLMDVTNLRSYWRKWVWPDARVLMIGMVPGVVLGALLFSVTSDDVVRVAIGLIALGFVAFQIARARGWIRVPPTRTSLLRGGVWGAASGFTSFVSHAGGPPAAVYLLGRGLDKQSYQATTVLIFWWVNILKFFPYAALGLFTRETVIANLALAPVAIAGALMGVRAHRLVPERAFFALTYIFLVATALKLFWDAAT
ncbi:sulfite exporter TauE/SafE family protein [Roseobacter sp. HKCCA0434]|uniref:sulfite exporter TauE/SafE family protein n=1 Tax=Roseobacter sp. HKCCA0434 TaxID=3079297 RepID=UPI002905F6E9|nr:sulfite exporter TauE/SafE family protein [Roseobacter sp. HKCCA0434]